MPVLGSTVDVHSETYLANRAGLLELLETHEQQVALGLRRRWRALRRPPPGTRQAARPRTDRAAARSRLAVPRALPGRSLGQPVPGRGVDRHRASASSVGRRVRDHRPRSDGARRDDESVHAEEEPARTRDRPRQPAAADQPGRVGRCRPADPGRAVHPRRADLPRPDRSCRRCGSRRSPSCSATRPPAARTSRACATTPCSSTARRKVFLGGPPLVKMATGEESDDEELGGAAMHSRISGSVRLLRRRRARLHPHRARDRRRSQLAQARPGAEQPVVEPVHDPEELLGIASVDLRVPFDPRDVIARVVDGSRFDEYKSQYGTSLVTGWARLHGYPIGILANARGRAVHGGGEEGDRVHPPRQPDRHPAAVPAEHHRLHGRQGLRAGRDHQGRREDDQRRDQLHACRT